MTTNKTQGFIGKKKEIKDRLKDFIGKPTNVQFECGSCCKKAKGGVLVTVGSDFIELAGNITIFTLVPGIPDPFKQTAKRVLIPLERICDIEIP